MQRFENRWVLVAALAVLPFAGGAKDSPEDYISIDKSSNAVWRIAGATNGVTALAHSNNLPALWFPVGEETRYNIYWGVLHVGSARVSTDWVEQNGEPRLRVRHVTKSNRVIAQLYPVEDVVETLIDPASFLPVYFRTKMSEGRYRNDEITVFNHAAGYGEQGSFKNGHVKKFKIDPDTRDVVTLMFWLRREPFTVGATNQYRVMADEKLYDLLVKPTRTEEHEVADYGRMTVTRIDPEAAFNGLFIRKGKMTAWISDDERRLCTKVEAEVPFANIHIALAEVRGPGDDDWVKQ